MNECKYMNKNFRTNLPPSCAAYYESRRPDGKTWMHFPECKEENCPIEHPELLENAILGDFHITMDYKEAISYIRKRIEHHNRIEPIISEHSRLNEALNMAIQALEEKIDKSNEDNYEDEFIVPNTLNWEDCKFNEKLY